MDRLAESIGLLDKIRRGELSDLPILGARRPAHGFKGISDIVRHSNAYGYQVATTHRLTDEVRSGAPLALQGSPHWRRSRPVFGLTPQPALAGC